jgi:hypothetical protein
MLYQQTIESLHKLKLTGMINALKEQQQNRQFKEISFEDRFGMLVDRELNEQENRRLELRLRKAKLRQTAVIEDVDFRAARGLSKSLMLGLATCDWLREHQNVSEKASWLVHSLIKHAEKGLLCSITAPADCSMNWRFQEQTGDICAC